MPGPKKPRGRPGYRKTTLGAGPVDARTTNSDGSVVVYGLADPSAAPILSSSMETAIRPACSIGEAIVVRGGLQKSAPITSSQPTTQVCGY